MVSFRNDVVVRRRVRRREPKSDIPLELITCNGGVCLGGYGSERIKANVSSSSRRLSSADGRLQSEGGTGNNQFRARHTLEEALPSNGQYTKQNVGGQSKKITHLPSLPSYDLQGHGPRPRSVQSLFEPLPGSIGPIFGAQPQLRVSLAVSLRTSL